MLSIETNIAIVRTHNIYFLLTFTAVLLLFHFAKNLKTTSNAMLKTNQFPISNFVKMSLINLVKSKTLWFGFNLLLFGTLIATAW